MILPRSLLKTNKPSNIQFVKAVFYCCIRRAIRRFVKKFEVSLIQTIRLQVHFLIE